MHELVISWFSGFPKELATFLIAIIPVTELRAALPVAYNKFGMSAFSAWFWSVLGTYSAMVFIVFLLDPVANFLSKHFSLFHKFFTWLFEHTRKRANGKMEKYGEWAIFILSATPIPFLGGLTGAMAAFIFGVPRKISLPLLLFGTAVSGVIVLVITLYL
jgi:uncharacterized membrane protein